CVIPRGTGSEFTGTICHHSIGTAPSGGNQRGGGEYRLGQCVCRRTESVGLERVQRRIDDIDEKPGRQPASGLRYSGKSVECGVGADGKGTGAENRTWTAGGLVFPYFADVCTCPEIAGSDGSGEFSRIVAFGFPRPGK